MPVRSISAKQPWLCAHIFNCRGDDFHRKSTSSFRDYEVSFFCYNLYYSDILRCRKSEVARWRAKEKERERERRHALKELSGRRNHVFHSKSWSFWNWNPTSGHVYLKKTKSMVNVWEDVTCFSSQCFLHSYSPLLQLSLLLLHLLQLPLDDLKKLGTGVFKHNA